MGGKKMITRLLTGISLIAVGVFGFVTMSNAAPIFGSQSKVENGCISPIPFFVGQDCSYDGSNPLLFYTDGPTYIGPIAAESYYLPGESAGGEGDPKRLGISGDLVVDGAGTISGTITIAAGERISACSQSDSCTETWDAINHTIPATAATSAGVNSAGGMDYTYSSIGYPVPLEPCVPYFFPAGGGLCDWNVGRDGFNFAAQLFPSVTPSIPFAGGAWKTNQLTGCTPGQHGCGPLTDTPGVTTLEGGFSPFQRNDGIQTTATMVNYSCVPNGPAGDCNGNVTFGASEIVDPPGPPRPPGWTEGNPAYENLHLKVSTNAAGTIIACEAVWVQEYSLISFIQTQPGSWGGGTLNCSGIKALARGAEGPADIQIDKKNILGVVIYGDAGFDVTTIDPASLQLGPGEFTLAPTTGGLKHAGGHIADTNGDGFDDLTGHFPSDESDVRCGLNNTPLRGTSDGVPFVVDVLTNGIGKACR
ncbi:MAG: hypothetical protein ACN4GT_05965 [Gammaproteobacteria bacterium]